MSSSGLRSALATVGSLLALASASAPALGSESPEPGVGPPPSEQRAFVPGEVVVEWAGGGSSVARLPEETAVREAVA